MAFYNETHSITFKTGLDDGAPTANTWTDWHLIPASRPTMSMPGVTTKFVDIPGRKNGQIDMSEYLTGGIIYGNRSGQFEFYVDNDHESWLSIRSKITDFLHGKRLYMILQDDPLYYYHGRFTLNEWRSDPNYSRVVISYAVEPYKRLISRSWLWDPFDFDYMEAPAADADMENDEVL